MAASAHQAGQEITSVSIAPKIRWYLGIIAFAIAVLFSYALVGYGRFAPLTFGYNFFAPIAPNGDANWYRDYAGRFVSEIQDQEAFYHNVGGSVAAAKQADIVILGPSFVSYAFDRDTMRKFEREH